jgi:hypothetical protein
MEAELITKDCFLSTFEAFFFYPRPLGLFFLGSCIGNDKFSAAAMLSFLSYARVANSSKDFGLMPFKI